MLVNTSSVISSAIISSGIGYAIGFPVSKYFDSKIQMRLLVAPTIGLGIFGAAGASIFHLLPLTTINLLLLLFAFSAASLWLSRGAVDPLFRSSVSPGFSWLAVAFLVCLLPAFAIIPQHYGESAGVGSPIWDHAKIAIVNEIAQNGLPPNNPFYSEAGSENKLIYYYVWHFIAASTSVITGASGWEADIALTGVTALCSTFVVAWLTLARSRNAHAAWWVLPLLLASSLRPIVKFASGKWLDDWVTQEHLRTWFVEAAWAPQHLFSGTVTLLVILAFVRTIYCDTATTIAFPMLTGFMLASAYGSSVWAGGFSLLFILPVLGALSILRVLRKKRLLEITIAMAATVAVTFLCAGVMVYEQSSLLQTRNAVDFWVFPVFVGMDWFINIPSFWVFLISLDFSVLYASFLIWCFKTFNLESDSSGYLDGMTVAIVLPPLVCAQSLHSVLVYNDLGHHAVIPSVMLMTATSASLLSLNAGKTALIGRLTKITAIILVAPSILAGAQLVYAYTLQFRAQASETEEGKAFRASPEMWEAVRRVTPSNEAVANNPLDLASVTFIPGNISWAVLSRRRNCATELELLRAYAAQLTPERASDVFNFFKDVFEGNLTEERLKIMKEEYLCKTLVVTKRDGLWGNKVLDGNSIFRLVSEKKGKWRIYR
ncbi:hypothetical protein [Mesorhizobium sp. M0243]|uniref:hypothetical protein n=1 Tax=Mesorhizobium sp. M0243 TaxID=2956925 RepID=UPI003337F187